MLSQIYGGITSEHIMSIDSATPILRTRISEHMATNFPGLQIFVVTDEILLRNIPHCFAIYSTNITNYAANLENYLPVR